MQIMFIDESGSPPPYLQPEKSQYFVLGGVVIPEDFWHRVRDDLQHLKNKNNVVGEIKWRNFAPHAKPNPLTHLDPVAKENFRTSTFSILTKYKSIKLMAVICDSALAYSKSYINSPDDLYWYSYKQLTERFQYYLQDISKLSGQTINGIIVCDNRANDQDNRLREMHAKLLGNSRQNTSNYKNLIEGAFIAPSHLSVGIQFADMIGGAIMRTTKNDNRFFDQVKNSFRKSQTGEIEGYGIIRFPKH